ncbi:hypothetical protein DFQ30_005907 [Apophysomyces sp. BC1015]|nr:hypothetical protein DFQ30_005907 [Apophysomyces sp. BC1015]
MTNASQETPLERPTTPTSAVTAAVEVATEQKDDSTSNRKVRVLTFIGLQLALFLAALDGTIVSTALPTIGSDFNEMTLASWVATAYILTLDSFQPLFSKFSDIFGRKWILMFSIALFLFGSVLCGAAKSIIMLIVARAIAGIGGGGILSMVFVIIADLVPLEKRGSYQGVINSVFALASVFGPLIGGSFTDYVSWRWNFYINLPIGVAAMGVLLWFLQLPTPKDKFSEKLKRIDYVGTVIVLAFSTLFLLAMNFGGQMFPWNSAAVIVPLVLTGVLVCLLVVVESKYAKEPLMPPRLFKNQSVVSVLWFMASLLLVEQASVELRDIAVVTGLGSFTRILGGALGVAISSAVLNSSLNQNLPLVIPPQYAAQVIQSSEFVRQGLPAEYMQQTLEVYVEALRLIWHVIIPMAGMGFIASLFVRHYEIRKPKANEEKTKGSNEDVYKEKVREVIISVSHISSYEI